ncbi:MAG: hypothetical protein B7733_03510 [Myxococcales bacterium FL481]|nr:MAG: hypothetical protein B7733_03510 [Myxococcales bacterium FL481]
MKRTDQERLARELGRTEKKLRLAEKRTAGQDPVSAGAYSKRLAGLLMSDGQQIYNIDNDDGVLEVLMEMREQLSDKELVVALRRAIKMTKVPDIETPLDEMMALVAE